MERRTVLFSGHVQGVGFRYNTAQIARNFQVGGFFRNLPDGRVELVAEGSPEEIEQFLDSVRLRMSPQIRNEKSDHMPISDLQYREFSISS